MFFAGYSEAKPAKNQITKISISDSNNQTELEFELSKTPKYRIFTISNPERLVIDFEDSLMVAKIQKFTHPTISLVRNSINRQGQTRIVFDLKNPIEISGSQISDNKSKKYLAITLSPKNSSKTQNVKLVETKVPTDEITKLLDKKTGTVKYVIKKAKILPTIIIDSGHGGKDPGTTGKYARSKEKHITLAYSIELKKQLDKTGKFKVFLTRDKDYFIPLNERVAIARRLKADLFISLHADSSPDSVTSGLSIYTLSENSSDKQAELLAQKENKADIIGGANFSDASGDILNTLINLSQRSTMNESAQFAEIVIKSIKEKEVATLQKGHRFAGFRVLTAPDVPSVLIELGYLSNKNEEKILNSINHKKKVAQALVLAVENYFGEK
ncbi:MAG: N-acetylmuramoyl-L-alanine amidase [Rickettsiaceae bacterium]|jgi:N-acetylmuramoyl-L-alanine amidase|nr:N-acetylmuramoyl-L-alanine amidase [Rickettsiaceae bacterium]